MTQIVGITGRKGHGKDTAAKALTDLRGYELIRFADPIKLMIVLLLAYQGVDEEEAVRMVDGDLKEVPTPYLQGKTPRHAMQTLGTEWGRNLIGDKIWTDAFLARASMVSHVVCSDLRFPNEVEVLKEAGAFLIRIKNPNVSENEHSAHPSEQYIDTLDVDAEIVNDETIAALHGKLLETVS